MTANKKKGIADSRSPSRLRPLARYFAARNFAHSINQTLKTAGAIALPLAVPGLAFAGPNGGVVTAGDAIISNPDVNTTAVDQSSQSAILNWESFSIGAQEYVVFRQPTSTAVALNRIVGTDPSDIYGSLTANGRVFLVNPNGVYFAEGSNIDVGALVATTLDIDDQDFLDGNYTFTGNSQASVTNAGTITADDGFVVLAGDYIENSGVIAAQMGQVLLASGSEITLDLAGDGLVSYAIDGAAVSNAAGVENVGQILADGGKIIMTAEVASDLIRTVVNSQGLVRAQTIDEVDGEIWLGAGGGNISHTGTLDASGGGSVRVTSNQDIDLQPGSLIDVSNADGTGGEARVIAEGHLDFQHDATIKGTGGNGADGGFVEVSGHDTLRLRGDVELGRGGTLLIDPTDINIVSGGSGNPTQGPSSAAITVFEIDIENQLKSGTNVQLVASNTITVQDLSSASDTVGHLDGRGTGTMAGFGGDLLIGIGSIPVTSYVRGANPTGGSQNGTTPGSIRFIGTDDAVFVDGRLDIVTAQNAGDIIFPNAHPDPSEGELEAQDIFLDAAGGIFGGEIKSGLHTTITAGGDLGVDIVNAGGDITLTTPVTSVFDVNLVAAGNINGGAITVNASGANSILADAGGTLMLGDVVVVGASGSGPSIDAAVITLKGAGGISVGDVDAIAGFFGTTANLITNPGRGLVNIGNIGPAAPTITTGNVTAAGRSGGKIGIGAGSFVGDVTVTGDVQVLGDAVGSAQAVNARGQIDINGTNILTTGSIRVRDISGPFGYDFAQSAFGVAVFAFAPSGTITIGGSVEVYNGHSGALMSIAGSGDIAVSGALVAQGGTNGSHPWGGARVTLQNTGVGNIATGPITVSGGGYSVDASSTAIFNYGAAAATIFATGGTVTVDGDINVTGFGIQNSSGTVESNPPSITRGDAKLTILAGQSGPSSNGIVLGSAGTPINVTVDGVGDAFVNVRASGNVLASNANIAVTAQAGSYSAFASSTSGTTPGGSSYGATTGSTASRSMNMRFGRAIAIVESATESFGNILLSNNAAVGNITATGPNAVIAVRGNGLNLGSMSARAYTGLSTSTSGSTAYFSDSITSGGSGFSALAVGGAAAVQIQAASDALLGSLAVTNVNVEGPVAIAELYGDAIDSGPITVTGTGFTQSGDLRPFISSFNSTLFPRPNSALFSDSGDPLVAGGVVAANPLFNDLGIDYGSIGWGSGLLRVANRVVSGTGEGIFFTDETAEQFGADVGGPVISVAGVGKADVQIDADFIQLGTITSAGSITVSATEGTVSGSIDRVFTIEANGNAAPTSSTMGGTGSLSMTEAFASVSLFGTAAGSSANPNIKVGNITVDGQRAGMDLTGDFIEVSGDINIGRIAASPGSAMKFDRFLNLTSASSGSFTYAEDVRHTLNGMTVGIDDDTDLPAPGSSFFHDGALSIAGFGGAGALIYADAVTITGGTASNAITLAAPTSTVASIGGTLLNGSFTRPFSFGDAILGINATASPAAQAVIGKPVSFSAGQIVTVGMAADFGSNDFTINVGSSVGIRGSIRGDLDKFDHPLEQGADFIRPIGPSPQSATPVAANNISAGNITVSGGNINFAGAASPAGKLNAASNLSIHADNVLILPAAYTLSADGLLFAGNSGTTGAGSPGLNLDGVTFSGLGEARVEALGGDISIRGIGATMGNGFRATATSGSDSIDLTHANIDAGAGRLVLRAGGDITGANTGTGVAIETALAGIGGSTGAVIGASANVIESGTFFSTVDLSGASLNFTNNLSIDAGSSIDITDASISAGFLAMDAGHIEGVGATLTGSRGDLHTMVVCCPSIILQDATLNFSNSLVLDAEASKVDLRNASFGSITTRSGALTVRAGGISAPDLDDVLLGGFQMYGTALDVEATRNVLIDNASPVASRDTTIDVTGQALIDGFQGVDLQDSTNTVTIVANGINLFNGGSLASNGTPNAAINFNGATLNAIGTAGAIDVVAADGINGSSANVSATGAVDLEALTGVIDVEGIQVTNADTLTIEIASASSGAGFGSIYLGANTLPGPVKVASNFNVANAFTVRAPLSFGATSANVTAGSVDWEANNEGAGTYLYGTTITTLGSGDISIRAGNARLGGATWGGWISGSGASLNAAGNLTLSAGVGNGTFAGTSSPAGTLFLPSTGSNATKLHAGLGGVGNVNLFGSGAITVTDADFDGPDAALITTDTDIDASRATFGSMSAVMGTVRLTTGNQGSTGDIAVDNATIYGNSVNLLAPVGSVTIGGLEVRAGNFASISAHGVSGSITNAAGPTVFHAATGDVFIEGRNVSLDGLDVLAGDFLGVFGTTGSLALSNLTADGGELSFTGQTGVTVGQSGNATSSNIIISRDTAPQDAYIGAVTGDVQLINTSISYDGGFSIAASAGNVAFPNPNSGILANISEVTTSGAGLMKVSGTNVTLTHFNAGDLSIDAGSGSVDLSGAAITASTINVSVDASDGFTSSPTFYNNGVSLAGGNFALGGAFDVTAHGNLDATSASVDAGSINWTGGDASGSQITLSGADIATAGTGNLSIVAGDNLDSGATSAGAIFAAPNGSIVTQISAGGNLEMYAGTSMGTGNAGVSLQGAKLAAGGNLNVAGSGGVFASSATSSGPLSVTELNAGGMLDLAANGPIRIDDALIGQISAPTAVSIVSGLGFGDVVNASRATITAGSVDIGAPQFNIELADVTINASGNVDLFAGSTMTGSGEGAGIIFMTSPAGVANISGSNVSVTGFTDVYLNNLSINASNSLTITASGSSFSNASINANQVSLTAPLATVTADSNISFLGSSNNFSFTGPATSKFTGGGSVFEFGNAVFTFDGGDSITGVALDFNAPSSTQMTFNNAAINEQFVGTGGKTLMTAGSIIVDGFNGGDLSITANNPSPSFANIFLNQAITGGDITMTAATLSGNKLVDISGTNIDVSNAPIFVNNTDPGGAAVLLNAGTSVAAGSITATASTGASFADISLLGQNITASGPLTASASNGSATVDIGMNTANNGTITIGNITVSAASSALVAISTAGSNNAVNISGSVSITGGPSAGSTLFDIDAFGATVNMANATLIGPRAQMALDGADGITAGVLTANGLGSSGSPRITVNATNGNISLTSASATVGSSALGYASVNINAFGTANVSGVLSATNLGTSGAYVGVEGAAVALNTINVTALGAGTAASVQIQTAGSATVTGSISANGGANGQVRIDADTGVTVNGINATGGSSYGSIAIRELNSGSGPNITTNGGLNAAGTAGYVTLVGGDITTLSGITATGSLASGSISVSGQGVVSTAVLNATGANAFINVSGADVAASAFAASASVGSATIAVTAVNQFDATGIVVASGPSTAVTVNAGSLGAGSGGFDASAGVLSVTTTAGDIDTGVRSFDGNVITLSAGNDILGTLGSLSASSSLTLLAANEVKLGGATITAPTLNIDAGGRVHTQIGFSDVAASFSGSVANIDGAGGVTLTTNNFDFSSITIRTGGPAATSAATSFARVSLNGNVSGGSLDIFGGSSVFVFGNGSFTGDATLVANGQVSMAGVTFTANNLFVDARGGQGGFSNFNGTSGSFNIAGLASFNAASDASFDFGSKVNVGSLTVVAGSDILAAAADINAATGNVSLSAANGFIDITNATVDLGARDPSGFVTAPGGALTVSGRQLNATSAAIDVAGSGGLTMTATLNQVSLSSASVRVGGSSTGGALITAPITIASGASFIAASFATIEATGPIALTAAGSIDISDVIIGNSVDPIFNGAVTISGSDVSGASADIRSASAINITGTNNINAIGATATVDASSAGTVNLQADSAIQFGSIAATGLTSASVTIGGTSALSRPNVTLGGPVTASGGLANIDITGSTLATSGLAANATTGLSANIGIDVTGLAVLNNNTTVIGSSTMSGLNVSAGSLDVAGTLAVDGAEIIAISGDANFFNSTGISFGGDLTVGGVAQFSALSPGADIILSDANIGAGTFLASAGGSINATSANLTGNNTLFLNAMSGDALLTNATLSGGAVGITATGDVSRGSLTIDTVTISGTTLTVAAGGGARLASADLSFSGAVSITANNEIDLDTAIVTGSALTLSNPNGSTLSISDGLFTIDNAFIANVGGSFYGSDANVTAGSVDWKGGNKDGTSVGITGATLNVMGDIEVVSGLNPTGTAPAGSLFASSASLTAGGDLTLDANGPLGNVLISGASTQISANNITVTADTSIGANNATLTAQQQLSLDASGSANVFNALLSGNQVTVLGSDINASSAAITVGSLGGLLSASGTALFSSGSLLGGNYSINAGGNVITGLVNAGDVNITAGGFVAADDSITGSNITISGTQLFGNNVVIDGTTIDVSAAPIVVGDSSSSTELRLTASGALTLGSATVSASNSAPAAKLNLSGTTVTASGPLNVNAATGNASINIDATSGNLNVGDVSATASAGAATITLDGAALVNIAGTVTGVGSAAVSGLTLAADSLNLSNDLNVAGNQSLTVTNNATFSNSSGVSFHGDLTAGGLVQFTATNLGASVDIAGATVDANDVTVSAAGDIFASSAALSGGIVNLTTSRGDVSVTGGNINGDNVQLNTGVGNVNLAGATVIATATLTAAAVSSGEVGGSFTASGATLSADDTFFSARGFFANIDLSNATITNGTLFEAAADTDILLSGMHLNGGSVVLQAGGSILNTGTEMNVDALALFGSNQIDLSTTNLTVGAGLAESGVDGAVVVDSTMLTRLSELQSQNPSANLVPTSSGPNLYLEAPSVTLGTLNLSGDFMVVAANNTAFTGPISTPNDVLVQLRPYDDSLDIIVEASRFPQPRVATQIEIQSAVEYFADEHFAVFPGTTIVIGGSTHTGNIDIGQNDGIVDINSQNALVVVPDTRLTGLPNFRSTGIVASLDTVIGSSQPVIIDGSNEDPQQQEFEQEDDLATEETVEEEDEEDEKDDGNVEQQQDKSIKNNPLVEKKTNEEITLVCR